MKRRPMLVLNGKPRLYRWVSISFDNYGVTLTVDDVVLKGYKTVLYGLGKDVDIMIGIRPSGRPIYYVDTGEMESDSPFVDLDKDLEKPVPELPDPDYARIN